MKGKNKCKILKEIRQKIADENDIPYVTRECTYQGACKGTCPKCEAELRYLEQELEKRRRLGQSVAIAAVAATLSLSLAGCVGRKDGGKTSSSAGGAAAQTQTVGTDGQETEPERTEPTEITEPTQITEPESTLQTESTEGIEMPLEGEPAVDETTTADTTEELAGEPEPYPAPSEEETEILILEGEVPDYMETEQSWTAETNGTEESAHD